MSRFFLWIKSQMLLLFLAHLRRLIYKLQLEVRVLSWWWPLTRGLTCGCGGERQTQHLRVMSLDLHQLFQKVQTKDTEHTHTQKHVSRSFYLCEDHVLFHSIRPCRVSYCRFPQRSPAARCCPSGVIPSTLIPVFPSAPADSPLSPSACRCCVFSPTYKILSRSWKTHRKWFMPTNKTRELLQAFCRLVLVHLFTCTLVCCWSYVAVEVSVCGGRVSVPQSDGVIRRTGEEGGWRQTGLRRIRQLRIHLKRKNTNRFTTTPEYIYTHTQVYINTEQTCIY